jgi:hypothetical protein
MRSSCDSEDPRQVRLQNSGGFSQVRSLCLSPIDRSMDSGGNEHDDAERRSDVSSIPVIGKKKGEKTERKSDEQTWFP